MGGARPPGGRDAMLRMGPHMPGGPQMFVNPLEIEHAVASAEFSRLYDETPEAEKAAFIQRFRVTYGDDFASQWLSSRK